MDGAVTTAFDNSWLKADSSSVMTNLQPLSIDNKNTIVDLQAVSQEIFDTYTVEELKKKYVWLENPNNLDMMFGNRFDDDEPRDETTTRNPENGIIFKETKREEPQWVPYSVFTTMLNGMQTRNEFSNKTLLFTGYAIKPRDETGSSNVQDENEIELGKCSISVRSYLICLGIQNEQDSNKKMVTNPSGFEVEIPSTDGGKEQKLITPEEVQAYAARRYLTISQQRNVPALMIERDNATVFNIWSKEAAKMKDQAEKQKLLKILNHGILMISPMATDTGFTIRE